MVSSLCSYDSFYCYVVFFRMVISWVYDKFPIKDIKVSPFLMKPYVQCVSVKTAGTLDRKDFGVVLSVI